MAVDTSIVEKYLKAMGVGDGATVRSLFVEDGVIDDYRGGHRSGAEAIERFMNDRPRRTIDLLSDVITEGDRLTVFTQMGYDDGRSKVVRFIFTTADGRIEHLVNSAVEFVPEDVRQEPKRLLSR